MADAFESFLHRESQVERALGGEILFGDDFTMEEISRWYDDEAEAYADLGARDRERYSYVYHALNYLHGFRHVPQAPLQSILGFGSAYGDELQPVVARAERITIVDPSEAFQGPTVHGNPAVFIKPRADGRLELESSSIDLVTCFGVLHHIPNVSFVVSELARVIRRGGWLLIREPIVSMGDWRRPRAGLTPHDRGIPRRLLEEAVLRAGCRIERSTFCDFSLTPKLFRWLRRDPYNSRAIVNVDAALAFLTGRTVRYHAVSTWSRLRPASVFIVAQRL